MVAYFDSSFLLSILLDEDTKTEAYSLWKGAEIRVSSILLKIETIIVLRRAYDHFKSQLSTNWLTQKTLELDEYLKEVNYRLLDEEIEQSIRLRKDLSKCRALDAIHIATALDFSMMSRPHDFILYSYDAAMLELARQYNVRTNMKKSANKYCT